MPNLDREKTIALGALALVALTCAGAVGVSLQMRSNAAGELDERRAAFSQLERRVRSKTDATKHSGTTVAPAAAFISAATPGLAGADLQAYLSMLANDHHATLVSSGITPAKREDANEAIRIEATIEVNQSALQAMLYQLESGQPYVFVESLTLQPSGGGAAGGGADPRLRVTLGLKALWRRGTA